MASWYRILPRTGERVEPEVDHAVAAHHHHQGVPTRFQRSLDRLRQG
ncbi:hypothetical protein ACFVTM_13680 [Arthrobacter sp. NPDC058130]